MTMPNRIQRRHSRGWRMPDGAVSVTRPGPHGNPFRVGGYFKIGDPTGHHGIFRMEWCQRAIWEDGDKAQALREGFTLIRDNAQAVEMYRRLAKGWSPEWIVRVRRELAGHDLACWCALCPEHRDGLPLGVTCRACSPCHADVLLELANG